MIPPNRITANMIHETHILSSMHLFKFSAGKEGGIERSNYLTYVLVTKMRVLPVRHKWSVYTVLMDLSLNKNRGSR